MKVPSFTITRESVTVVWEGKPHTVQKGSPNFIALRDALQEERWDDVPKNLTPAKSITAWAKGKFSVSGDRIMYGGEPIPEELSKRIITMSTNNENPTSVLRFWEKLSKNPSYRSVNQLWEFLKHAGIPLTPSGCFLAYKSVRNDYKDVHSGTVSNEPGVVNEMPRNKISDDPKTPCHEGFHVGALSYAQSFGGSRIVVCEVDPEHVVCVPYDESHRKMRVCKYKVIGNYGSQLPSTTFAEDEDNETEVGDVETPDVSGNLERAFIEPESGKATDEKDKAKTKAKSKKKTEKKVGKTKYDKMDMKGFMNVSLEDLRKYARGVLKIVGASKIPGGKIALITAILKTRDAGKPDPNDD